MVLQAGLGFSFLTLTLTYFMSVYSALARRNRFALMLHHRTADSGDVTEFVTRLMSGDRTRGAEDLAEIGQGLDDLYESHHFFSILHYFCFPEPHYAMARILLIAMDTATLIRSVLDETEYRHLIRSSAVEGLWRSGIYLLARLGEVFLPQGEQYDAAISDQELARWETKYRRTVERLQSEGVAVTSDLNAGLQRYIELRRQWNNGVLAFGRYMGRDWSEIEVEAVGSSFKAELES